MKTRTVAALAGLVALGMASPTPAKALPTCTTISVVALPGYQCELGGLTFGSFNWNVFTHTEGGASFSGPSSYDLVFGWVGNKITVTYRPVGGSLLTALAQTDPNDPNGTAYAYVYPSLVYDVTVNPATTLFGASALYSLASGTTSGAGHAYARHQGSFSAFSSSFVASANSSFMAKTGFASPLISGGNICAPGNVNLSNSPLSTGNILCGPMGSGTTATFETFNYVDAIADLYSLTGAAAASGSVNAAWSNTFTTSLNASAVPEPATVLLMGTGLAVVGLVIWRRRRGT